MKIAFVNRADDDVLALLNAGAALVIGCFKDARIKGAEFLHCETAAEAQVLGLLCCLCDEQYPLRPSEAAALTPPDASDFHGRPERVSTGGAKTADKSSDAASADATNFAKSPNFPNSATDLAAAAAGKIAQIAAQLDAGELSGESCFGEEEAEEILNHLANGAALVLAPELAEHPQAANVFCYAALLAARFGSAVYLGAQSFSAAEFAAFAAPFRPSEQLESRAFDGIALYACLAPHEPPRISPAAARLAAAKKLDLARALGAAPTTDFALKGLFILTPRRCGYPFALLKENECK